MVANEFENEEVQEIVEGVGLSESTAISASRFVSGEVNAIAVNQFNEQISMVRQFGRPREYAVGGSGVRGRYECDKRLSPKCLKKN